jgi:hypothetical protein
MTPKQQGQDMMFSVAEAARVLGMQRQALYAAINAGRLAATGEAYGKQIKASDLIAYGIRAGRDPGELVEAVKRETNADMYELLMWVLLGLGLYALVKLLMEKKD